jgi:hypothetical protein
MLVSRRRDEEKVRQRELTSKISYKDFQQKVVLVQQLSNWDHTAKQKKKTL